MMACRKPLDWLFGNKKTFEQAVDDLYQQYVDGGATMPAEQLNALQALVKKPSAPTDIWTGRYVVDRRENWEQYLEFLKVPEANWEIAKKAPDFHEYYVTEDKFFMDHRIPAHGLHLRIDAFLDNEWCESPYKRATPTLFQDGPKPAGAGQWKHRWVVYPTSWETTIPDFSGTERPCTWFGSFKGRSSSLHARCSTRRAAPSWWGRATRSSRGSPRSRR
jgi:hypothetical protein